MKKLTSAQVRQLFLQFFKEKGHQVERSVSLVPKDDPSLLWINSGVATLKKYFDGTIIPENPRIVNVQKSIRTNDIENVGFTARHHTFFEMLGNFSIGDYFKKEAIIWAWEFLTSDKWIGFDEELLSVTVHPEDDEAYDIWLHEIKLPEHRIIRLEENFWDIGEGPSGPNTEIFYDRGEKYGNDENDPELYPGGENERYLEVWNLVFSQFNHNPDDTYTPLPKKNIDTGMGLERLVSLLQDAETNFDTDLFVPIIKNTERLANIAYGQSAKTDTSYKIIADHIRTVAFAIGDHALPSNEGRGYILRRLIRRAVRYAKQIGIEKPFMYKLVPTVGEIMQDYYPEVLEQKEYIMNIIKVEEERFNETLNDGLERLTEILAEEKAKNSTIVPGKEVFKLYDTYGFPKELTEEYVEEYGFTIDEQGFQTEMEKQRTRAREAREEANSMQVQDELLSQIKAESTFIGYQEMEVQTDIVSIIGEDGVVNEATQGVEVSILLRHTPFYAESGGQVADIGTIFSDTAQAKVIDVQKAPTGQHLHRVEIQKGTMKTNEKVTAMIDESYRAQIIKNHTATHLLHQALRDVLGEHIHQAGSLVTPDRLRFDFTHFQATEKQELDQIEQLVNEKIWANISVLIENMTMDEAKATGAMALFGEKYGDIVRVVQIGDYSIELCGGCHVNSSAEIGLFKIVSESGIGAGVRRIEAVTSKQAFQFMQQKSTILSETAALLKTKEESVISKLESLFSHVKQIEKEKESLQSKLSNQETAELLSKVQTINGIQVLSEQVSVKDIDQLRKMMDYLKQKLPSSVILLAAENNEKVLLLAGVSKDLIAKNLHAGKLISNAAKKCGGGGGGRPDLAQAGGKDRSKITEALETVYAYIDSQLT
ncbi:alanine--tRNA ligase [Pseudogracilibacillus auburnensis]|uniref:Alanine--tRNA ligase n=1 Tax=Pseudogracilibacillus auburnensis TaxID=1494959 RepID=A0A2V3VYA6_9BACI|nr:alanine--tRNA ligase [Pseudogracilibacillus auburnensis]PXW86580.1 alanyl-tRNA synthetase [Pseudogracilibacillus auburnensis]